MARHTRCEKRLVWRAASCATNWVSEFFSSFILIFAVSRLLGIYPKNIRSQRSVKQPFYFTLVSTQLIGKKGYEQRIQCLSYMNECRESFFGLRVLSRIPLRLHRWLNHTARLSRLSANSLVFLRALILAPREFNLCLLNMDTSYAVPCHALNFVQLRAHTLFSLTGMTIVLS